MSGRDETAIVSHRLKLAVDEIQEIRLLSSGCPHEADGVGPSVLDARCFDHREIICQQRRFVAGSIP